MMGTFIDDAIYNYLNTDGAPANDVDLFFNNAGGIRTDWCFVGGAWANTGCVGGTHAPALLTYGNMFTVLPFGNATAVGKMTGAQILEVLNYAPNVAGVIQPAGLKYKYYAYKDANPGSAAVRLGRLRRLRRQQGPEACEPLDLKKTYNVGTNEFLAPAGGDGYDALQVHDEHHVLGRHAQRRQRVRGGELRHAGDGLHGPQRRRDPRRADRP